jgi:hypothetical protein
MKLSSKVSKDFATKALCRDQDCMMEMRSKSGRSTYQATSVQMVIQISELPYSISHSLIGLK